LREEVVDRFSNEFTKLYAELDSLKRTTLSEEEGVMRTLDDVRSREDDKLVEQRNLLRDYESQITQFRRDLQSEVVSYRGNIVGEVEKKLKEVMDAEEVKEQREQEMIEEIRIKVEREFADQFENRFNVLENQLKEKEKMAVEARQLLDKLQNQQQPMVS
jgi:hypothetical protein